MIVVQFSVEQAVNGCMIYSPNTGVILFSARIYQFIILPVVQERAGLPCACAESLKKEKTAVSS